MRRTLVATMFLLAPLVAQADETIAGQWQANLSHNVIIAMDVLADGHWASQTVQDNKVVAEMAGTYEQTRENATAGTLVFTPIKSKTSEEHGKASVERDRYSLQQNGRVLHLTVGKDVMDFHKQ